MVKAIDKIHQCQISEREYYEEYMVWDETVTKCIWNGKCSANGKCTKQSNCLLDRQIAYLAWKESQKELALHEITRNILTYRNNKK